MDEYYWNSLTQPERKKWQYVFHSNNYTKLWENARHSENYGFTKPFEISNYHYRFVRDLKRQNQQRYMNVPQVG